MSTHTIDTTHSTHGYFVENVWVYTLLAHCYIATIQMNAVLGPEHDVLDNAKLCSGSREVLVCCSVLQLS